MPSTLFELHHDLRELGTTEHPQANMSRGRGIKDKKDPADTDYVDDMLADRNNDLSEERLIKEARKYSKALLEQDILPGMTLFDIIMSQGPGRKPTWSLDRRAAMMGYCAEKDLTPLMKPRDLAQFLPIFVSAWHKVGPFVHTSLTGRIVNAMKYTLTNSMRDEVKIVHVARGQYQMTYSERAKRIDWRQLCYQLSGDGNQARQPSTMSHVIEQPTHLFGESGSRQSTGKISQLGTEAPREGAPQTTNVVSSKNDVAKFMEHLWSFHSVRKQLQAYLDGAQYHEFETLLKAAPPVQVNSIWTTLHAGGLLGGDKPHSPSGSAMLASSGWQMLLQRMASVANVDELQSFTGQLMPWLITQLKEQLPHDPHGGQVRPDTTMKPSSGPVCGNNSFVVNRVHDFESTGNTPVGNPSSATPFPPPAKDLAAKRREEEAQIEKLENIYSEPRKSVHHDELGSGRGTYASTRQQSVAPPYNRPASVIPTSAAPFNKSQYKVAPIQPWIGHRLGDQAGPHQHGHRRALQDVRAPPAQRYIRSSPPQTEREQTLSGREEEDTNRRGRTWGQAHNSVKAYPKIAQDLSPARSVKAESLIDASVGIAEGQSRPATHSPRAPGSFPSDPAAFDEAQAAQSNESDRVESLAKHTGVGGPSYKSSPSSARQTHPPSSWGRQPTSKAGPPYSPPASQTVHRVPGQGNLRFQYSDNNGQYRNSLSDQKPNFQGDPAPYTQAQAPQGFEISREINKSKLTLGEMMQNFDPPGSTDAEA